jgi:cytoskeletal protein CcmA (bactofilin family)
MPPNKGFISLNSSHIILKSSDFEGEMNLDGDLKIEKYLYGNIYFGNYSEILNNSLCIILPLESKNQLYN